jgi:group I intron endonuclease
MDLRGSGIYQIRNILNNKVYIGSSYNIEGRWYQHKYLLKKGKHHSYLLQKAWDEHGEGNFEFEVIELNLNREVLFEREQYWMDTFNVIEDGYNVSPIAGKNVGRKMEGQILYYPEYKYIFNWDFLE